MSASFKLAFEIVSTETFQECLKKECKKFNGLSKKVARIVENLKRDPFQGERVEFIGTRRIWVGRTHRLFYDIQNNKIFLISLRKKGKDTYKNN